MSHLTPLEWWGPSINKWNESAGDSWCTLHLAWRHSPWPRHFRASSLTAASSSTQHIHIAHITRFLRECLLRHRLFYTFITAPDSWKTAQDAPVFALGERTSCRSFIISSLDEHSEWVRGVRQKEEKARKERGRKWPVVAVRDLVTSRAPRLLTQWQTPHWPSYYQMHFKRR